ncbi:MAG: nucleotidyltransferase substrate binding protein [Prochlorococcaceae cyanobacterium]
MDAATPRRVIREAFACGLLREGQLWIDMLEQHNLMAHTYDAALARRAVSLIQDRYAPALGQLATALASDRDQLRRDQRRTPQG